ncbi:unnamed protein product [Penicillium olsonii]|nr:unnamed protein product [Penicillium olsonii]
MPIFSSSRSRGYNSGGPVEGPQPTARGVKLDQVYPPSGSDVETEVDIIAIHGLDTKSPDTWTWKKDGVSVNWLKDSNMLPEKVPGARIFTCDWPSELLEHGNFVQKTIEEFALLMLDGIKSRETSMPQLQESERPIIFVASCLGGVILMKTLAMNTERFECVKKVTRGFVFLATPFRGTSFEDVVFWAKPGLRVRGVFGGKRPSNLMNYVMPVKDLELLVRQFSSFCERQRLTNDLFTFYETGDTSLPRKAIPFIPRALAKVKPLVNSSSATLDFAKDPMPIDRPHVLVNKFEGPDDPEYAKVSRAVQELVNRARHGRHDRLIERAKAWIQDNRYSLPNLEIKRLSGDLLPMNQCYINLALVERQENMSQSGNSKAAAEYSPLSLQARLNLFAPREEVEIYLQDIFNPRMTDAGQEVMPRRILIHGRAGVGKTTLCKKVVYEFTYGQMWHGLFEHLIWIPLRKLKRKEREKGGYDFGDLFRHELFSNISSPDKEDLSRALWDSFRGNQSKKILFLLDGLDEVSRDVSGDMRDFLRQLLNQPYVIITSRPNATSTDVLQQPFDLELETIGFHPEQVTSYIETVFTDHHTGQVDSKAVKSIGDFLESRQLMQDLVRIPIQLDALCYTWHSFAAQAKRGNSLETMTGVYEAMEISLWKKDLVNLGKSTEGEVEGISTIATRKRLESEIEAVQLVAFTGMYSNIIDFEPHHRDAIFEHVAPSCSDDRWLERVSFLRTSDSSSDQRSRVYHFLHLTFQEYFAAQYFVRKWRAREELEFPNLTSGKFERISPPEFLGINKYNTRYDIVWRFVAGLLGLNRDPNEPEKFFRALDQKPLDLLGIAHQRLLIHCLSEVQHEFSLRREIQRHLSNWLVFQCNVILEQNPSLPRESIVTLASESEFPERALIDLQEENDENVMTVALLSMRKHHRIQPQIMDLAISMLQQTKSSMVIVSMFMLLRRKRDKFSEDSLQSMLLHLWNPHQAIKLSAAETLRGLHLPETICRRIIKTSTVRKANRLFEGIEATVLSDQALSTETLNDLVANLVNPDKDVRQVASHFLSHRSDFPPEIVTSITQNIGLRDSDVKWCSINALRGQSRSLGRFSEVLWTEVYGGSKKVSGRAIEILYELSDSPENVLDRIMDHLGLPKIRMSWNTLKIYSKRSTISEKARKVLQKHLQSSDYGLRCAVIDILAGQPDLSVEILKELIDQLETDNETVIKATVNAISCQSSLPVEIDLEIAERFDQGKLPIKTFLQIFENQSNSPERVLGQIAAHISGDKDHSIRAAAIRALGRQSYLSETPEIIQKMIPRIHDEDAAVRVAAIRAVGLGRPSMSDATLGEIMRHSNDTNDKVRQAVVQVLGERKTLSLDEFHKMVELANDPDEQVQWATHKLFAYNPSWPGVIRHTIASEVYGHFLFNKGVSFNWMFSRLAKREEFHLLFLLGGLAKQHLRKLLLRTSRMHLAWFIKNDESYLERSDGSDDPVPCVGADIEQGMISAWREAGLPPVAVSYS